MHVSGVAKVANKGGRGPQNVKSAFATVEQNDESAFSDIRFEKWPKTRVPDSGVPGCVSGIMCGPGVQGSRWWVPSLGFQLG